MLGTGCPPNSAHGCWTGRGKGHVCRPPFWDKTGLVTLSGGQRSPSHQGCSMDACVPPAVCQAPHVAHRDLPQMPRLVHRDHHLGQRRALWVEERRSCIGASGLVFRVFWRRIGVGWRGLSCPSLTGSPSLPSQEFHLSIGSDHMVPPCCQ